MSVWQIFLRVVPYAVVLVPFALFRDAAWRLGPAPFLLLVLGLTALSVVAHRFVRPFWRPPS